MYSKCGETTQGYPFALFVYFLRFRTLSHMFKSPFLASLSGNEAMAAFALST